MRTVTRSPSSLTLLMSVLVSIGCAGCSLSERLDFFEVVRDPWREPIPPAATLEKISLETSGVGFELPSNHRTEACCVLGRMATIHGEVIESPVYAMNVLRYRRGKPVNALELTVDVVTPWMMGADRGELQELAAAADNADVALWLFHRVFTPRVPDLKADAPRTIDAGGLRGVTFEAWRETLPGERRDASRVTVISLTAEAAVVIQGRFDPDAAESDHKLYRKIVQSLRTRAPKVTI